MYPGLTGLSGQSERCHFLVVGDDRLLPDHTVDHRGEDMMRRTARKPRTTITEDLIHTMRVLRFSGQSVADIATALKVSEATVSRYTREEVE